jgi:P4 family phage/plasmid primase-like protien
VPNNIAKLYEAYAANTARFPAILDELADQLGVSPESVARIGTGFIPVDEIGNWAWVFPERNAKGEVVGLHRRFLDGKKYMVTDSKRGLIYAVNIDTSQYEKRQWIRVSADKPCPLCGHPDGCMYPEDKPCPLCGHPDGCMYPEDEYDNPNAVACVTTETGSTKQLGLGWLHIFDPARQKLMVHQNYSILLPSDHPILVVEGASDVCAAYDLGFTAVGKPSAAGKSKELPKLLNGRNVVVLGENDAGAGRAGMEATAKQLQAKCPEVTKVMPPTGIKDLRQWLIAGVTQAELLQYIEKMGDKLSGDGALPNARPLTVASAWLDRFKKIDGKISFGIYRKGYVDFNGKIYEELSKEQVYGQLYRDLGEISYLGPNNMVLPYSLDSTKVRHILQACCGSCLIDKDVPCWLTPGKHPNPERLIVFRNGILDVDEYIAGNITLHPPTPDYFTFSALPYDFDETLDSNLWYDTRHDILQEDTDKLQFLAQWFGLNIVPDRSFQKLTMLKGPTGSGKGTIIDALAAMLGDNNCASPSFQSLSCRFGFASLRGKLCAVITDAIASSPYEAKAVLAKLLTVVGADSVAVDIKQVSEIAKLDLYCRFTFAMNDFIPFRDNSFSLERRTNILTFNNSYVGREDTTLRDRLKKEASEGKLINYALRGLKDLYTRGKFIVPGESAVALASFRQLVSPVSHFAQYCIELDPTGPGAATDELYDLWKWWCNREGNNATDELYDLWKWWCNREGNNKGRKVDLLRTLQSTIPNTIRIMEGEVGNPDQMMMGIKITDWAQEARRRG